MASFLRMRKSKPTSAVKTAEPPAARPRSGGRPLLKPAPDPVPAHTRGLPPCARRYTGNGCFLSLRARSEAPTKSLILNGGNRPHLGMTLSVQISRGIESLFGTRDENI